MDFRRRLEIFVKQKRMRIPFFIIATAVILFIYILARKEFFDLKSPYVLGILLLMLFAYSIVVHIGSRRFVLPSLILDSVSYLHLYAFDMNDCFMLVDNEYNDVVFRLFHFRPRVGESPFNHISKENAFKFKSNLNHAKRAKRGEAFTTVSRISRGQKTPLYLEMIYSPIYDHSGRTIGVLCLILDVTWQKTREEKVNEMILKDSLTKLYNRSYVESAFNECMFNKMETVTLILSDLNDFKHYNDTKGHIYGDNLLVRYARILEDIMPDNAVVARLGGDEFVVLLPGVSRKQTEFLINVARLAVFEDIGITASYGFHTDSYASHKSFEDFYMIADRRMYRNKKNKRNLVENE